MRISNFYLTYMESIIINLNDYKSIKTLGKEHLSKFFKPKSKILCTFGGGSIDKNGCRSDVNDALKELDCETRWEGGIPPNPEYERLMEIVQVFRAPLNIKFLNKIFQLNFCE